MFILILLKRKNVSSDFEATLGAFKASSGYISSLSNWKVGEYDALLFLVTVFPALCALLLILFFGLKVSG